MTKSKQPRRWLQWSLRSILLLMLLVSVLFVGRMSLQSEVNRLRAENDAARAAASVERAQYGQDLQVERAWRRRTSAGIDEGMKADEVERRKRSSSAFE